MDLLNKHENQQGRGKTFSLWKNFPEAEIFALHDLNVGYGIAPNLASFDTAVDAAAPTVLYGSDGARGYIDTGCTIKQMTLAQGGVGGGIRMATAATDNVEAWLQYGGATGSPFRISDTAAHLRDLVFEVAFRVSTVADTKAGFFIGLMEEGCAAADTITDAGALADKDYIGFHRLEGDGDKLDIVYKKAGSTAVTHKADWKTIAADTWYHVGLRWDATRKILVPWFGTGDRSTTPTRADNDNKVTAVDIASTTDIFPDGQGLSPIIGLKNAAAAAANLDFRLLRCGQMAPAAD